MTVAQYFHKVEISELDPQAPIGETRMKRIIIHGLRPEYRGFVAAVQGWKTQSLLVEFENLLAGQEALAKQMGGASPKGQEEALYANNGRWNSKQHGADGSKKNDDDTGGRQSEGSTRGGGGSKSQSRGKKFEGRCFNCKKKGHMEKECRSKKKGVESNAATFKVEEEWDAEAFFAAEEEDLAFTAITSNRINYEKDWIVDSGCSNHMTGDVEKLQNLSDYKGSRVVVTAYNSKLPIAHVGSAIVSPQSSDDEVPLQNVYHVPGYDNQRKGWRCCDPVTGKCYISRNVVFEEASSWWSSDKEVLPDSDVFKEALESSQIHLSLDEVDGTVDEGNAEEDVAQNPWQTGVYQQPSEEGDSSGVEKPLLRRSTRTKKPNPRDCEEEILQTKENLSIRFLMKELGQLNHFFGLEIDSSEERIFLHQQKYFKDLLKKFGMLNCKPISTPMEPNANKCAHEGKDLKEATMYRQLVGSLLYLTLTRPDISYAVGVMSRYMQNPKKLHLEAVRGILRYVKGTLDYGIIYKKGGDCKLVGFCDADYAGDHDTRRSTTGYIFTLGSGVVSWCSKRQPAVSLSTTEAEYRAAAMAAQESTWILQLLEDLHQPIEYPISLYCDNLSAIRLAENPVFHARIKHVEVYYHFIRKKVLQEEIELEHVITENQVADLLTKSLSENKFQSFRRQLGMANKGGASVEGEY
ncbi:hypothetical protein RJ639_013530 [Escallonia herrerae]|uniref:CCHC-type domain-containing protein n=1 Tax=Escallonia herrerae TaxID=1293975 RepID=A0AA88VI37_9ASTE|nr:hypothetical protein RJ639_013530 [Escallonia herrerae]